MKKPKLKNLSRERNLYRSKNNTIRRDYHNENIENYYKMINGSHLWNERFHKSFVWIVGRSIIKSAQFLALYISLRRIYINVLSVYCVIIKFLSRIQCVAVLFCHIYLFKLVIRYFWLCFFQLFRRNIYGTYHLRCDPLIILIIV